MIGDRGRPVRHSAAFAALSISAATSFGCERHMAWLPGSSIVSDLARPVMKRSNTQPAAASLGGWIAAAFSCTKSM